jgi:hypothetical protein
LKKRTTPRSVAARAPRDLPAKPTQAGIVQPPRPRQTRGLQEAIGADANRVVQIYTEAETGRTARQIDLYKGTRLVDGRLNSVCNARVLGIVGRPVVWKPPPGFETDAEALDNASMLSQLWGRQRGSLGTIGHLAHGTLEGHAFGELHYYVDDPTGWTTARIAPVRADRLMYAGQMPVFLQNSDDREGIALADAPEKWIFHAPGAGASDYPWRMGALRSRMIASTIKRFALRAWIALLERWGQPQIAAFYDPDMDVSAYASGTDPATLITDALKVMGIDWRAAFPKGTVIEAIPVSVSDALHKTFIDASNTEDAIAILGQNLTTEVTAGGFAATVAHGHVRKDILAADWLELAETITDQWAENIIRYNRPGSPVPYAEAVLTPKRELTVAEWQSNLVPAKIVQTSMGLDAEIGPTRFFSDGPPSEAPLAGSLATDEPSPSAPSVSGPGASTADNPVGVLPAPKLDAPAETAPAEPVIEDVASTVLNGAQIQSLQSIAAQVTAGELTTSQAIGIIEMSFPTATPAQIAKVVGTGKPAAPPTPAP